MYKTRHMPDGIYTGWSCVHLDWMQRLSQAKSAKILSIFLKEEKICFKKWYVTLCILDQSVARNRASNLEVT